MEVSRFLCVTLKWNLGPSNDGQMSCVADRPDYCKLTELLAGIGNLIVIETGFHVLQ